LTDEVDVKNSEEILHFQAESAEYTNHTTDLNNYRHFMVFYLLTKIQKWSGRKEEIKNSPVISL